MPRRPSTHVDDPLAVGERLRSARKAAGLTQRDLSFEGCTAAYVSRIEAGARVPSLQILHEFARRLGVSPEFLARGQAGKTEPSSELLEAEVALQLGDERRAEKLYESARAEAVSPTSLARALLGLGRLALRRGNLPQAIILLEQALNSDELGPGDASAAANALGRSYAAQGKYEEAFALFQRFLEEARTRGDPFDRVRFAVLLANAYIDHADYGRAHATLGEVLDLARHTLDPLLRASLYWSQSRAHLLQGDTDRAAEYGRLALATLTASEQTLEAARALLLLAFIENDRGNAEAALELVNEGEPVVAAAGDAHDAAMFTIERARALSALGEAGEAAGLLLGIAPRLNDAAPGDAARAYAAVADIFRKQGDLARALELYELAVDQAPTADRHVVAALNAMAEIYEERGETQKALDLLKQALAARAGAPA
ncbi:MAG TPA: tetratricopeptide repeat protein [Solirubrobacteraceae bacterium]|nr:tetratricopeptide repeat protein [Solirubrobacteraceae bacterium]